MPKAPKPKHMTPDERNSEVAEHFALAFIGARIPAPLPRRRAGGTMDRRSDDQKRHHAPLPAGK